MAGGQDVGYYTLPVILSFSGVDKQVNSSLGKAFGVAGKKGGQDFARSVAAGISSDKSIEKATEAKAKAMDKVADATGRAKIAERTFYAQREKFGASSRQAEAAEIRFAAAKRKVSAETRTQTSATKSLEQAIKAAKDAESSSGSGGGFLSGTGISAKLSGLTSSFGSAGTSSGGAFVAGAGAAILAGGLIALGTKAAGLVAEGFSSVVEAGVDFDKTFNNFQAVTRSNTTQMAAFRQEAISLGGDTQIAGANASDAATAMTELAKAGFTVDQAMAGARGTLQLAAAAQITAAEAATIEGNALNAFGLDATHAGEAADVLANVANASSGEMTDFAYGLQAGGTVAHQFGLTIEDTSTALGLLANSGIKGSDAGTLLKTSLLALTDQGNPAQGAIHDLGLTVYDATGNFVGMRDLIVQLQAASKRMTPEMYQAATSVLFGSDAARLAGIAAEQGSDGWDKMATAVAQQGTAAEVARVQNQGLPGVIENIKNTADTLKLTLYDLIRGPLTSIGGEGLAAFSGLADTISKNKPEIIQFFTEFATASATALSGSLRMVGMFTEGLGQIVGGFGNALGAAEKFQAFLADLVGDTEGAARLRADAEDAFGWGESLQTAGKALQVAADGVNNFKPTLQAAGDQAKQAATFMRDLGDNVKLIPESHEIVITDNSIEAIRNIDQTKFSIEQVPGTKEFRIVPKTQEATDEMNAWRKQQGDQPVAVPINPTLTAGALQQAFSSVGTPNVPGTYTPPRPGSGPGSLILPVPRARGGIDVWDSVASFANGKLPQQAMIQRPVGGAGLVQWAEPSTGGEAFIPLNGGKRSRAIWAETGRRLMSYEAGGIRGGNAGINALYAEVQALTGTKYSMPAGDDCSGTMSQLVNAALGLPPKADRMSTATAAKWLANKGALPGLGPAGTFRMGWKNGGPGGGHMAGTLPDGTHVEMGGANGGYTVGGNAKGAEDPSFTDHAYLPIDVLYPDGYASGAGSSPWGSSSGGSGMAGVGPNGESGTYAAPEAKAVREAQQKVDDADKRVAAAEQRQRELKADAKQSQKDSAQTEVDKAKREAADARSDQAEVMKGKFKADKGGKSGGSSDMSELGSIAKSFVTETFGLDGSWFPDIGNLAPLKMMDTLLGAFMPAGGADSAADAATTSSAPFGMPDVAVPPPGSPASGTGLGPLPGPGTTINVDGSTQIAGNVGWDKAELDRERDRNLHRAIARVPVGS